MPISIEDYFCVTPAGLGPDALFRALLAGTISRDENLVGRIHDGMQNHTSEERLVTRLLTCWQRLRAKPERGARLGILLASTKGMIEDFIWTPKACEIEEDPLTPLLSAFVKSAELNPIFSLCVSNACASSHGAFYIAKKWLDAEAVDHVIVLAIDEVGPFIYKGFTALGALSPTQVKPFAADRDGLQLGEGAAVIVLSNRSTPGPQLLGISIDSEGHSITRPSPTGRSLAACCEEVLKEIPHIDGVIAHATGTKANDFAEDQCFSAVLENTVPITATKWCVGHTLGASGAIDLIAACEALKHGTLFSIPTSKTVDGEFKNRYLTHESIELSKRATLLVTSLGFGGTNAALVVRG